MDIQSLTNKFYVITPIFNPYRFRSRYKLYQEFRERLLGSGVNLVTVECAFAERPFAIDNAEIKVRSSQDIWLKENLINLAIARLPPDWEYVAWLDGDTLIARPDWVTETVHLLQHYHFVQLFSQAADLSPTNELLNWRYSFVEYVKRGGDVDARDGQSDDGDVSNHDGCVPCIGWATGFAWAARRSALDKVGGLIDWSVMGSGQPHMAYALMGKAESSVPQAMRGGRYYDKVMEWQETALAGIKTNVGVMEGLLLHFWHGNRANRQNQDRWDILERAHFNPDTDLRRDWQGLWQLIDDGSPRRIALRDGIRDYFTERDEDSIDVS